jgi:CRISPR-associated protein (TIGR03986 family)
MQFINPYNFTRLHHQRTQANNPIPHDRFYITAPDAPAEHCYSGTIRCRLTVETPLFIPDSERTVIVLAPEDIEPDLKRIEAQEGSEVTFTEDSLGEGDETRWEVNRESLRLLEVPDYRNEEALRRMLVSDRKHGRVKRIDGGLRIVSDRPLKSGHKVMGFFRLNGRSAIASTSLKGMIRSLAEAASNSCLSQFDGDAVEGWRPDVRQREDRREYGTPHPGIIRKLPTATQDGRIVKAEYVRACIDDPSIWDGGEGQYQNGDRVWFRRRRGRGVDKAEWVTRQEDPGLEQGRMKISGDMPEKRHHRIFYIPDTNATVRLSHRVLEDFRVVSKAGKTTDLNEDDLIYYHLEGDEVVSVGNAHIYKRPCTTRQGRQVRAVQHQGRLSHSSYSPCTSLGDLCPCCALFGIVTAGDEVESLAGRVCIGTAWLEDDADLVTDQTLQILASPKPQCAMFYLMKRDGTSTGRMRWQDNASVLRGRKFYWHKQNLRQEDYNAEKPSKQNSTVELLNKGEFKFTVGFYNLRKWEVGLLLWSLDPGEGFRHKLGMGKPLGLGSVKITIEAFNEIRRDERYRSILTTGDHPANPDLFILAYKKWISGCQSDDPARIEQAWQSLPFMADLLHLLRWQSLPHPVQYPRSRDRDGNSRGYQWFVDYRNNSNQTLPIPEEVTTERRVLDGWQ